MTSRLTLIAVAALAALALVSASAAAAVRSVKPDLAMRSVSVPQTATPGALFGAQLHIARRGRTGTARIGIYLSRDRVHDRTDQRMASTTRLPVGAARSGAPAAVTVIAEALIPSGQAPGKYFVIACVDDPNRIRESNERNNCRASSRLLTVTAIPVSTAQLLAAAVAAHKLTAQQALVYRVFAAFGDPRLPSIYAGDSTEPDDLVMGAVADAWPTLSAPQQSEVRPFFTPPPVSGSWFSADGSAARASVAATPPSPPGCRTAPPSTAGWYTFAKSGGHVRLWWSSRDNARIGPAMRSLASDIESTIWPRLHALMGREPLSDGGVSCFHGIDGKLDIYMLHGKLDTYANRNDAIGVMIPYPPGCKARPAFIVFDVRSGAPKRWLVAHELMHAFQYAFHFHDSCTSYGDWNEATATWAQQYVYPHDDERPYFSPWYPESPLTKTSYEGWMFPYAMAQLHGAQTIAAIYGQTERLPVAQAIDAGLPGGLAQAWPEFALKAWNASPVAPSFRQWDNFDEQPLEAFIHQPIPVQSLAVTPDAQPEIVPRLLQSLTRAYYHFAVAPNVTKVSMSQQPVSGIRVDLIERFRDGTTQIEQLQQTRTICSMDPAKRLADLVLVISNSSLTSTGAPGPLRLAGSDGACGPIHYRVLSASFTLHTAASEPGGPCGDFGGTSGSETITGTSSGPAMDDGSSHLDPYPSGLSGDVFGKAEGFTTYQGSGCKVVPGGRWGPCSYAGSNVPIGPHTFGFEVDADPASGEATLSWGALLEGFGAPSDECDIHIGWKLPPGADTQTVPLAKLLSPDPQTFTFAGSVHLDHDAYSGRPASIDDDWNLSLTVQRQ